jgi:outer membrane protein W
MRKLILFAALMGLSFLVKAQSTDYHAFKFDLGLGYAEPSSGSGTKAGATFTLQPHYRLTDDFAVGLRYEAALIGYENNTTGDINVAALISGCATAEYYLSDSMFRPFVGAGVGVFDQASANSNDNSSTVTARSTNLGGFPEIGFELGHLRVSIDYNIAGSSNNYVAFHIGAFFGGGKQ